MSKDMSAFVDVPLIIALPAIRLDCGFIVALLMAVVVSWLLFRTTKGFELRASGFNMTAARYAGMSAGGSMMLAMAMSGGLAGLAGAFLVLGTVGQLSLDLSGGIGFNAIALALLAGLRPSGVVLAALLFGALTTGGKTMGIESGIPFDLLVLIMALVIMFVAAPGLIRTIWRVKVASRRPRWRRSRRRPGEAGMTARPTSARRWRRTRARSRRARASRPAARSATRASGASPSSALGVLAFYFASRSHGRRRRILVLGRRQGGEPRSSARRSACCGSSPASPPASSACCSSSAARVPVAAWLVLVVAPWIAATLAALLTGRAANLTGMVGGSLELATPLTLGAMAGILSERSGMLQHRARGQDARRRAAWRRSARASP